MTEEPKSFTVKDRRHFTSDGQAREPGEGAAGEPEAAPPAGADEGRGEDRKATRRARPPEGPIDFAQFVLSLGAQASLLLAGQREGEEPKEALAGARAMIGILEMLKDKTEGRRTPGEDQVLDGLLYELRMAYVARAREAGE
jgi:hypothetical protein